MCLNRRENWVTTYILERNWKETKLHSETYLDVVPHSGMLIRYFIALRTQVIFAIVKQVTMAMSNDCTL